MSKKITDILSSLIIGGVMVALYSLSEDYLFLKLSISTTNNTPKYIMRLLLGTPTVVIIVLIAWIRHLQSKNKELKQDFKDLTHDKYDVAISALAKHHSELKKTFGVYWDSEQNMYCLSCMKPLKNSSNVSPSWFYCSDPKCNSKHILKDNDGYELSRQQAIDRMTKK